MGQNMWTSLPAGPAIAPSLLSVDFARAGEQIDQVLAAGAEMLHMDIMDGHFVPNLSMGVPVVEKFRRYTDAPLDVHLMVSDPGFFFEPFAKAGADSLNFHIEACGRWGTGMADEAKRLIERIRKMNLGVGVTIKPQSPVCLLQPIIDLVDMILVMTVEPGFGGQSFMADQMPKVSEIKNMLKPHQILQVDGGIDVSTITVAHKAGADVFVAGNSVFATQDPGAAVKALKARLIENSL